MTLLLTILFGLIAVWPYSILKIISRVVHFLLFKVLNYRKDVVQLNMLYTFPDTPSEEIFKAEKKFYRHFSDLIIEVIKSFYMPIEDIPKIIQLSPKTLQLIEKIRKEDRHVLLLGSHYGNWEFPIYLFKQLKLDHQFYALYSPLSFEPMNDFFKERRERYGAKMINNRNLKEELPQVYQQKSIIALIADQSPTGRTNFYETRFLGLDTKFFNGGERIAKDLNAMVLYCHFNKKDFAQYEIDVEILTEDPNQEVAGAITEKYVRALEKDIKNAPQYWLWTHKRWKGSISY